MNYIRHLTGFFDRIVTDDTLNPTHISLYISLFQFWNINRFQNPISITRNEIMKISKICSKATYHKCMKDLHNKGYLNYIPSFNPFKGSLVHLLIFDPDFQPDQKTNVHNIKNPTGTDTGTFTSSEQALVPYINYINNTNSKNNEDYSSENSKTQNPGNQNPFTNEKRIQETNYNRKNNYTTNDIGDTTRSLDEKKKNIPPELSQIIQFFNSEEYPEIEAHKFYNHFQSNGWKVGGKSPMKDWHAAARNWMLNTKAFNTSSKPNPSNLNRNKNYGEPL